MEVIKLTKNPAEVGVEVQETLEYVKAQLYTDEKKKKSIPSTPEKSREIKSEVQLKTKISDVQKYTPLDSDSNTLFVPLKFSTSLQSSTANVKEHETYREIYDGNDSGFTWGEKIAKDNTWEERWLQQKITSKNNASSASETCDDVIFGKSSGVDSNLCQRWTASWETEYFSDRKIQTVKKIVQKFDSPSFDRIIEEWDEEIINEEKIGSETSTKTVPWEKQQRIRKTGCDKQTQRHWNESSIETFHLKQDTAIQKDGSQQFISKYEEHFNEQYSNDKTWKSRDYSRDFDGSVCITTKIHSTDAHGQIIIQTLNEEVKQDVNGDKIRSVFETTEDGLERTYKKLERADKSETVIETLKNKVNGVLIETVTENSLDGSINKTRTETVFYPGTSKEKSKSVDERWLKPDGESWGKNEFKKWDDQEFLTEQKNETWYNNLKEKFVDHWETVIELDDARQVILKKEQGHKHGDRYSDETEWGEQWCKLYEPFNSEKLTDCDKETQTQIVSPELVLRSRHQDKWWKEPSGNQWGEKRFVDLKDNTEHNENWYDNGQEKQVDRWTIDKNGQQSGEKFGQHKNGKCEWNEKWNHASNDAGDFWIDKYWKEHEDQKCLKWGETEGRDGKKQWKKKWNENQNEITNTGSRYTEKWDDDGYGNFQTWKQGTEWERGETVNWYSDQFGESLGNHEKWAVKKGGTAQGDTWTEKWNETSNEKSAEKNGSNNRGDQWHEAWKEVYQENSCVKWAEKSGKNNQGEEWSETWFEDEINKLAKKKGKNVYEEWQEEWGEQLHPDGSGEKWTSKWSQNQTTGDRHGQNWGDKWGPHGVNGHHWDEKWSNDHVVSYAYDTPGRPEGC